MSTTAEHIAARTDPDLLQRLVAAAEQLGVISAQYAVEQALGRLVAAEVTVDGQTTSITAMHAYAKSIRDQAVAALPDLLGRNPGAVTDPILAAAIQAVLGAHDE